MKKVFSAVLSLLLVVAMLAGCSVQLKEDEVKTNESQGFTITYNTLDGKVDLHTSIQQTFIEGENKLITKLANGKEDLDKTPQIKFEYSENFILIVSENDDMADSFYIQSEDNIAYLDNLKVDTVYYINALVGDKLIKLDSITTANCLPRVINVDGVKNVRDIGGWETLDGHKVKQGMIYRCGRLNESDIDYVNIEITQSGIDTFVNRLGVKTEIDFRCNTNNESGTITESPLGSVVKYYCFSMPWEGDFYLDNKQEIANVFKVLADESNYPLIYHCNIGTDRTGMFTLLINGLLGVSEEDITKDYLFSNFANIGGSRTEGGLHNCSYYKELMDCDGDTFSEKVKNFLLNNGVTEEEIQSIISIMKE